MTFWLFWKLTLYVKFAVASIWVTVGNIWFTTISGHTEEERRKQRLTKTDDDENEENIKREKIEKERGREWVWMQSEKQA